MDSKNTKTSDALGIQLAILIKEYKDKSIDVHEFIRLVNIMYQDYLDFHPEEREYIYAHFSAKTRPGI